MSGTSISKQSAIQITCWVYESVLTSPLVEARKEEVGQRSLLASMYSSLSAIVTDT